MRVSQRKTPFTLFAAAIAVVFVCWFSWFLIVLCWSFSKNSGPSAALQSWAQLGDSFGTLNALFSGLALAAVALALWEQIQLQKDTQRQLKHLERQVELGVIQSYLEAVDLFTRVDSQCREAKKAGDDLQVGSRLVSNLDAIARRLGDRVDKSLDSILENPTALDEPK